MITVAWPGQPWLDRKLREGDTLLVSGRVKFFHGRQLQPREYIVLERGVGGESASSTDTELESGMVFVSYPASEDVPQWVLRSVFDKNLTEMLTWADDDEYVTPRMQAEHGLPRLCLLYTSPSPRDKRQSRMPSSA